MKFLNGNDKYHLTDEEIINYKLLNAVESH